MNNYQDTINCLPCNTFIMCDACPYYNRCKYIHDPRIQNINYNIIQNYKKTKNNDINCKDIFFWPYNTSNKINGIKYYNISKLFINRYNIKFNVLYSIWYNFIDICNNEACYYEEITINEYTNNIRLAVFIRLSK